MEVSGQLHAPAALPPGKDPWYPLGRRLGGTQSRSGRGDEEKNSQPLPAMQPWIPDRQARSLVAIPTELSLIDLSYPSDLYWSYCTSYVW
jgi:hypothetical protein